MQFQYKIDVGCDHVGKRVTVRSRTPDGYLTDRVGTLEECSETEFRIRDKRGVLHQVSRATIVASKVIEQPG